MSVETADSRIEKLVADYGALIRSVATRMLGRRAMAARDDVEQEVVVALWKRLRSAEPIEHPAAYVCQAARREAIRVLRREAARLEETAESLLESSRAPAADEPSTVVERRERSERLGRALESLGSERRRAVQAHLMGFDVQEIMDMYGWSYNRARNLIARGFADVRKELGEAEAL